MSFVVIFYVDKIDHDLDRKNCIILLKMIDFSEKKNP